MGAVVAVVAVGAVGAVVAVVAVVAMGASEGVGPVVAGGAGEGGESAVGGVRLAGIDPLQNVLDQVIIHVFMNDDMCVSVWQDGSVDESATGQQTAGQSAAVREVDDVETLKALADPTRMEILSALTRPDLPVMSVKELAARMGQPQTKLYRHVRHLEEAGLIKVAATRMVSGILEQRYQACQRELKLSPRMLRENMGDAEVALQTVLDQFRDGILAATLRESEDRPVMFLSEAALGPVEEAELRRRLMEVSDWLDHLPEHPGGVPVRLMVGLYTEARPTETPA